MKEFLEDVWVAQSNGWGFICVKDQDRWEDIPVEVDGGEFDMPEIPEDADVYFTPNTYSQAVRRKQYMCDSAWLYADLDKVNPIRLPDNLMPTVAWSSSTDRFQGLWFLPVPISPESHGRLNKQLTYVVGADRSGWDATQVLRLPGTANQKYEDKPTVRVLWSQSGFMKKGVLTAIGNYEMPTRPTTTINGKLPTAVQMKLKATVATGDRSKVLWKLERQLLECGYSQEQVFWVLRSTVWNKFDTDAQLIAEIARAAG